MEKRGPNVGNRQFQAVSRNEKKHKGKKATNQKMNPNTHIVIHKCLDKGQREEDIKYETEIVNKNELTRGEA